MGVCSTPCRRSKGGHEEAASDLAPLVVAALRQGDAVLVKGSYGSRMRDRDRGACRGARLMLYALLLPLAGHIHVFNLSATSPSGPAGRA